MNDSGAGVRAMLDAWRDQGADRFDPIRFQIIVALERRVAGVDGETRRLLDGRLFELIGAYAEALEKVAFQPATASNVTPGACVQGAVGLLVDRLARQAATRDGAFAAERTASGTAFPEMAALDEFRKIWSRIRTESQLQQQSLEQIPEDAGPLNSARLVHRSLTLMRDLAPGYLQQFLSYVDTLALLEQMTDNGVLSAEEVPRIAGNGKRVRSKTRRRD
ncbi:DUF2894 domain-containing protein [Lysobacter cavernae]|uniref:DUF2894 domain-containing protein n=1 Tax=Lysobacter cavernae TaxID=1685901 RepID=A0ABV7RJS0_9GAMM